MNAVILDMGAHRNLKGHNMEEGESQTSIAWQWRWDVLRSDMAAHTKLVLIVASFHGDADGSNIRPTLTTLSKLCSLDERTVKKARDAGKGWLKVSKEGRGRGKATEYKLTIPRETLVQLAALTEKKGASQAPFFGEKDASQVPFSDVKGGATGTLLSGKGGTGCPPLQEGFLGEKGAPGAEKGGAGRPPTCPVPVTTLQEKFETQIALQGSGETGRVSHADLLALLEEASGGVCDSSKSVNLQVLSDPRAWIENNCSLYEDILPTIKARCANRLPNSMHSWVYFHNPVLEARDRRLAKLRDPIVPISTSGAVVQNNSSPSRQSRRSMALSVLAERKANRKKNNEE